MAAAAAVAGFKVVGGTISCVQWSPILKRRILSIASSSSAPLPRPLNPISRHRHHRNWGVSFCTSPNINSTAMTDASSPSLSNENENGGEIKSENDSKDSAKDAGNMLDIRVGRVIKAWRHEEADSLYVEEVDVGEEEPRIICSGLVNYVPLHLLQDAPVVVLANLKPRNMRGVKSCGMLLAASDASHENVELLVPPEGSLPGDRVWFGAPDDQQSLPVPASPNQVQKKKVWELVQPHLKTDASCIATLGEHLMRTPAGAVSCKSLKHAKIS